MMAGGICFTEGGHEEPLEKGACDYTMNEVMEQATWRSRKRTVLEDWPASVKASHWKQAQDFQDATRRMACLRTSGQ